MTSGSDAEQRVAAQCPCGHTVGGHFHDERTLLAIISRFRTEIARLEGEIRGLRERNQWTQQRLSDFPPPSTDSLRDRIRRGMSNG